MTSLANYSKWDRIELSDDEDNFHPNIDNNLMIRLQREKRQQREAEEEEKRKKLEADNSEAAKEELARMERTKKLHVGNISTDKFVSKHEKSAASESANPMERKDEKLKVAATNEATFTDGYEAFLEQNRPLLMEYAAIDEEDEKSEQFILANTQLLSEHATGFCARPRLEPRPPPSSRRGRPVASRRTDQARPRPSGVEPRRPAPTLTRLCSPLRAPRRRPAALHQPAGGGQDAADAQDGPAVPAAHVRMRPRQVDARARRARRDPAALQEDGAQPGGGRRLP